MPFSSTGSIVSTDLDNMLRGLYRDNSNRLVDGALTLAETDMASVTITGGTIGTTGALLIFAAGTISGANSTKDIRLKLGGTTVAGSSGTVTVARGAAFTNDWFILAKCVNTAANAQRWMTLFSTNDAATCSMDYSTTAINTAANQILKVTGDVNNAGDTITQTMFDVYVAQIA